MLSRATIEVFIHPTEDEEKVLLAVGTLANGLTFQAQKALSHWHSPITVLVAPVDLEKLSLAALKDKLGEDAVKTLIKKRLDAEGTLHLRFDKQEAAKGKIKLTDGSDCIKLAIHTKNFPRNLSQSEKDLFTLFV